MRYAVVSITLLLIWGCGGQQPHPEPPPPEPPPDHRIEMRNTVAMGYDFGDSFGAVGVGVIVKIKGGIVYGVSPKHVMEMPKVIPTHMMAFDGAGNRTVHAIEWGKSHPFADLTLFRVKVLADWPYALPAIDDSGKKHEGPSWVCNVLRQGQPQLRPVDYWMSKNRLWIEDPSRPGDSGSPVYDAEGRILGIVVAILRKDHRVTFIVTGKEVTQLLSILEIANASQGVQETQRQAA